MYKRQAERRAALKELFKGEKGRRLSAPVPPACSVRGQNWLDNYQSARLYAEKKGSHLSLIHIYIINRGVSRQKGSR